MHEERWGGDNLQMITDMIPALISFFDADHVCRYANNYHRHWYGRTPQELVGLHMREFLGDEGYAQRSAFLARVGQGELVAFDAQVPHLDGALRDAAIRYVPRMGQDGFEGFFILVFDTAYHQQRFHSVFDGTAVAFLELDLSAGLAVRALGRPTCEVIGATRLAGLNAKAASIFGLDREVVISESVAGHWPPASEAAFEAVLSARDSGAASFETETTLLRSDGTSLDVLLSCAFPTATDNRATLVLGLVDLTDRNAREAAVAELQSGLAHAARVAMLGELMASIAHEVNQPLGAVVNNGNAALRWLNRPEPALDEVRRSLELLVGEAKRASEIIKRTRALATRSEPQRAAVAPASVAGEALAIVARQVTSLGSTLQLTAAEDLPLIMVDRVQIQQVLVNLMINAAQAMVGQQRPAKIRVSAGATDTLVRFAVDDTGPGITPEKADDIFRAFYTTKDTGMGIGLSVSKAIVEAHGGTIAIEKATSGGARFVFTIPLANE